MPAPLRLVTLSLFATLAACSAEVGPPRAGAGEPPRDERATGDAPAPAAGAFADDLPGRLLAGTATATELEQARDDADATVAALIAAAATGDVTAQGRAPGALAQLGKAAVPGLVTALGDRSERHRRIAALTLLHLALALHAEGARDDAALTGALAAAQQDTDPAVAAAAKHALRRITGDTSALDTARVELEAAEHAAADREAAASGR